MKICRMLAISLLGTLVWVPYVVAQSASTSSPDALVRMYRSGESKAALEATGWPCPSSDAFHQDLASRLQQLEATPVQVRELAAAWAYANANCNDANLSAWYRHHLATTTDVFAALTLGAALSKSTSAEDHAALKDVMSRDDLSEEARAEILSTVRSVSPATKIEWLADGIAAGKTIPRAALTNILYNVPRAEKPRVRAALVTAIKQAPSGPRVAHAIMALVGEADGSGDDKWVDSLAEELHLISRLPNASAHVKAVTKQAVASLRANQRR